MTRLPNFDPSDLRDHADPARVERIWARVSTSIKAASIEAASIDAAQVPHSVVGQASARSQARRSAPLLMFAAAFALFGGGLWVGQALDLQGGSQALTRSPDAPMSDIFATGSSPRTFMLPGGGRLSLDAESTVEVVDASDGHLTLRLMRGIASVEASGAPVAIVSGQALVTAPAGASVMLRRSDTDVMVSVSAGAVEVTTPTGDRHTVGLSDGQTNVPIATLTKHDAVAQPDNFPTVAVRPETHHTSKASSPEHDDLAPSVADATAPAVAPLTTWLAKYQQQASQGVQPIPEVGDAELTTAIAQAQSAKDLMDLSDIAGATHRDSLAVRALVRVADDFPSDPNRQAAAAMLTRFYSLAGNQEKASKYAEIAKQAKVFAELALCDDVRTLAADDSRREEAVQKSEEYLSKYPEGPCAVDARALVDDASPTKSDGDKARPDGARSDGARSDGVGAGAAPTTSPGASAPPGAASSPSASKPDSAPPAVAPKTSAAATGQPRATEHPGATDHRASDSKETH